MKKNKKEKGKRKEKEQEVVWPSPPGSPYTPHL